MRYTFEIPDTLVEKLDEVAKRRNLTIVELFRLMLKTGLVLDTMENHPAEGIFLASRQVVGDRLGFSEVVLTLGQDMEHEEGAAEHGG